ncbi:hypothetical protein EXE49_08040 [Halorubrum sp. ASP121]|uniref:hypothetical protein n=1 Tax=Halorubrum sp. ASP121 TaxID=1855858 RepID=UPI0010FA5976|nr:hypothetical protein [Halorubrum sp. ASP121]TKX50111.1 hypothetical protein EXE49_08040 [Halorubrum sp. ASP121]
MANHQHVMYASKGAVEQVYSELFGDVDYLTVKEGSRVSGSVGGKIGEFLAKIKGEFNGELTESEIKSINFDDEMFKAKKLANEILADESIPDISRISDGDLDLDLLYRFSCDVETKPFESEIDNQTYIMVTGESGEVTFRGDTSVDNWGLRSHIIQSVRAARRGDTYPYQGVMWPLSKTQEGDSSVVVDVDFLIICGPERELRDAWYDRMTT